ncbi:hypothetical protein Hanom_Chr16g01469631 [Helianthus anomalus]
MGLCPKRTNDEWFGDVAIIEDLSSRSDRTSIRLKIMIGSTPLGSQIMKPKFNSIAVLYRLPKISLI